MFYVYLDKMTDEKKDFHKKLLDTDTFYKASDKILQEFHRTQNPNFINEINAYVPPKSKYLPKGENETTIAYITRQLIVYAYILFKNVYPANLTKYQGKGKYLNRIIPFSVLPAIELHDAPVEAFEDELFFTGEGLDSFSINSFPYYNDADLNKLAGIKFNACTYDKNLLNKSTNKPLQDVENVFQVTHEKYDEPITKVFPSLKEFEPLKNTTLFSITKTEFCGDSMEKYDYWAPRSFFKTKNSNQKFFNNFLNSCFSLICENENDPNYTGCDPILESWGHLLNEKFKKFMYTDIKGAEIKSKPFEAIIVIDGYIMERKSLLVSSIDDAFINKLLGSEGDRFDIERVDEMDWFWRAVIQDPDFKKIYEDSALLYDNSHFSILITLFWYSIFLQAFYKAPKNNVNKRVLVIDRGIASHLFFRWLVLFVSYFYYIC